MSLRETVTTVVREAVGADAIVARAQAQTSRPIPLRQRGRTGNANTFNAQLHPRGPGGKFAQNGGRHARTAQPRTPAQIKAFQKQYNLPATGELDAATRATIAAPPPETVGQQASKAASEKLQAEKTARKESRAKTNARRKEEGKGPVGSSTTSGSAARAPATGAQRSALVAAQKIAHDSGNQALAESLRAQIDGSSGSGSSAETKANRKNAAALRAEKAQGQIEKLSEGNAWTGKLTGQAAESLTAGKGMGKGETPSPAVGLLQSKLQALGYNLGDAGIDGKLGPATETAVKVLQKEYGLKPDGKVGALTLQLLETLTERSQRWAKQGIIAAEVLPQESTRAAVRAVLSAGRAVI